MGIYWLRGIDFSEHIKSSQLTRVGYGYQDLLCIELLIEWYRDKQRFIFNISFVGIEIDTICPHKRLAMLKPNINFYS